MAGTSGTVLAVDDDSDLRSLYRCWLAESHEVRTAADGVEALRAVDETVDIVLLDREMPRRDGVDVAREVERRDIDPAVVMISGVEPGVDLLDIPVDDYLRKPVSAERVHRHVDRAAAVADQPRPRRNLVSLDRRRQIVETSASKRALTGEPAYQSAADTLDRHSDILAAARNTIPAAAEGASRDRTDAAP